MTFSADGKLLLVTGYVGGMSVWDWASGKERSGPKIDNVRTIALSSSGKLLAFRRAMDPIRLWDIDNAREIREIGPRRTAYPHEAFSFADNDKLLMVADGDGLARAWDVQTGAQRLSVRLPIKGDIISCLKLAPGGKTLAYSVRYSEGGKAGPICLFDLAAGKELHYLRVHQQSICALAFSPDGAILASSSIYESPILWDVATGKELRRLQGENHSPYQALAFSADGRFLVSSDNDKPARLWSVATGKVIESFRPEFEGSSFATFSHDGQTLAVADDNAIRLFSVESGKEINPPAEPVSAITDVGWLADDKTVALATRNSIWLYGASTGKSLGKLYQTPAPQVPEFFTLAPDGKSFVVMNHRGGKVRICDMATGTFLRQVETGERLGSLAFSRDGKTVAALAWEDFPNLNPFAGSRVPVFDAATGKSRRVLKAKSRTEVVAVSPDGKMVATAWNADSRARAGVQVWSQASGKLLLQLPVAGAAVEKLAFAADSRMLTALLRTDNDGGLIVWDFPAGKQRFRLGKLPFAVETLAISPDGQLIACEAREHAVCLLDSHTGKERRVYAGHKGRLTSLVFAADGKMLVSGSADATALVWRIAD